MEKEKTTQERLIGFDKPKLALKIPLKPDIRALESEKKKFIEFGINMIDSLNLDEEQYFGRPRAPYSDIIKSLLVMAFNGLSYRRSQSDIVNLYSNHMIDTISRKSTLHKYMNEERTKKILDNLVQQTALFFREHEDTLIVDSTWFGKRMYTGGYTKVHDKQSNLAKTRKMHIGILKNSRIIAVCKPTRGTVNDFKIFEHIVVSAVKNGFSIKTLLADKGYAGKQNYFLCSNLNIENIFIDFKSNVTMRRAKSGAWRKQLTLFREHPEIWKENYRFRVIIESVISSIKKKQKNYLTSKNETAMDCELLLKCLVHNLTIIGKHI